MKHSIEDIKRLLAEADGDGIPVFNPHAIIRDLLGEVEKLQADRQLEKDIDLYPGTLALKRENEKLKEEIERLESLAASRLADQESIEKHTARVCAEICDEIDGGYGSYASWASAEIRKRYGVES